MAGQQMMPTAFVEQPQFAAAAAPYFATQESVEESDEEAESADESEEADSESDSEETESDEAENEADSDEARFMEQTGPNKKQKRAAKKAGKGRKAGKKSRKLSGKKYGKKSAGGKAGKKVFKPKMGKPQNNKRSPSAKTPKAAGGRALPPMPAPLAPVFKIDCKKIRSTVSTPKHRQRVKNRATTPRKLYSKRKWK